MIDSNDTCVDINECDTLNSCDQNALCLNTDGSYRNRSAIPIALEAHYYQGKIMSIFCSCSCSESFHGDGKTCFSGTCTDAKCSANEQCVSPARLDCQCKEGFNRNETGSCIDTDECSDNEHNCNRNADCFNTEGTYKCSCKDGFYGDGESCLVGKCLDLACGRNQTCVSATSTDCKCVNGYAIDQDTGNCYDVDECDADCSTNGKCVNTLGSYYCLCNRGYKGDGKICTQTDAVLVLHSIDINKWSPAVLINSTGNQVDFNCFRRDSDAQASRACSITWRDEMYVFGAYFAGESKQISRLDGYTLSVVGNLAFNHFNGACSVMNEKFIFLCFSMWDQSSECRRATDPLGNFIKVAKPEMSHLEARTSASNSK